MHRVVLICRIFADALCETAWQDMITIIIERKLSRIKLPYWIEALRMSGLETGARLPVVSDVAPRPMHNELGVWLEMALEYHGGLSFRLETKINLMKLKQRQPLLDGCFDTLPDASLDSQEFGELPIATASGAHIGAQTLGSPSSDASDDEQAPPASGASPSLASEPNDDAASSTGSIGSGGRPPHRLLGIVDRISSSRFFQRATENRFIKRAMEGVSNTPLVLHVRLERLAGRLQVNMPPAPSDRIWYGFVPTPEVHLKARPFYGECLAVVAFNVRIFLMKFHTLTGVREFKMAQITDWIERKLVSEFHKVRNQNLHVHLDISMRHLLTRFVCRVIRFSRRPTWTT